MGAVAAAGELAKGGASFLQELNCIATAISHVINRGGGGGGGGGGRWVTRGCALWGGGWDANGGWAGLADGHCLDLDLSMAGGSVSLPCGGLGGDLDALCARLEILTLSTQPPHAPSHPLLDRMAQGTQALNGRSTGSLPPGAARARPSEGWMDGRTDAGSDSGRTDAGSDKGRLDAGPDSAPDCGQSPEVLWAHCGLTVHIAIGARQRALFRSSTAALVRRQVPPRERERVRERERERSVFRSAIAAFVRRQGPAHSLSEQPAYSCFCPSVPCAVERA